ncbi:lipase family protein [Streptomyces sp. NBC_00162]|nr:lipase family protein [Streptomyces sp. NBC_00162]UUU38969.1 lipase family protein [Streptomyces sp. NBC_00162]
MGYSQGGQASSWVAELQGSYRLQVKGTATGGVPADLLKVADFINGSYSSGLIFMAAAGQDADAIAGSFKRISDLTTRNPLAQPDWQARLNQSRLGRTTPAAPVYQYHALGDELIPYGVGRVGEHVSGVITHSLEVANWLADRFAGRSTHPNC